MNTLVSQNPILRFKEGNILKFLFGKPVIPEIRLEQYSGNNFKNHLYSGIPGVYVTSNGYLYTLDNNGLNEKGYIREKTPINLANRLRLERLDKTSNIKKLELKLYPKGKKQLSKEESSSNTESNIDVNNIYTNYLISQLPKNKLSSTKSKTNRDWVRAFLQKMIDAGYDLGKYGADGIWGKDTRAAYEKYIASKEAAGKPVSITPYINLQWDADTIAQSLPIQLPTVPKTYNRSQTRDLIRNIGLNPYSFSGAQRAALRHYLNGESDNTLLLTDGLELFIRRNKKGGLLVSKNPIERFKSLKKS